MQGDSSKWQVNFEDIQSRKILEIHEAVKVLNQNYLFLQKDSKDKYEILSGQIASNASVFSSQIKDMKHFTR